MSKGRKDERALHILVVPLHAEGHVNGLLRLAQYVAAREGVVVTFAYPARFYHLALKRNRLEALLASTCVRDTKLRIRVVEDGLPREEEQSITPDIVLASMPIFQNNVKLLLEELLLLNGTDAEELQRATPAPPLTCIISDTFTPWTQDLANAARLPRVDFWTSTAAVYSMGSRLSFLVSSGVLPLPSSCWVDVETKWTADAPLIEGIPGLPPFPATDLPKEFVHAEKVTQLDLQFMLTAFRRVSEAHTILIHSLYELESPVFDALQATGLPIHAVGPFTDTPSLSIGVNMATPSDQPVPNTPAPSVNMANRHECLRWLDTQVPSSVVYVALGTVAKLTPAQLHALALGLEASKSPFVWVIRADALSCPLIDALPPGFVHRTVDNGASLIVSWAPQTQVLAHPSIAAFISHCGWNSTLESMWEGVPMVACPLAFEQRSNARWIVDNWKIGAALERQTDGSFTQEAVEKALREVLSKDDYRQKMLHVKEIARHALQEGGSSNTNIVTFLENLRHAQCK